MKIEANPKDIKHSKVLKILGIEITEDINWKHFLLDGKASVMNQIITRLNALKLLKTTTSTDIMRTFANGILMSKLYFGAEVWAGAPKYIIKKISHFQPEAARICIGPKAKQWFSTSLQKELKWPNIQMIAQLTSAKLAHRILKDGKPVVLSHRMKSGIQTERITRATGPFKQGPKPAGVDLSKFTKYQFRPNSYRFYQDIPQILRQIRPIDKFSKRLTRWLIKKG